MMFCSTIIPTIGRPSLDRAVNSVLAQEFDAADFEIIVVNDSGRPLPLADWQQDDRVQIIQTQKRERSVARNTGTAVARGTYLHFLDDDDWLLPGALAAFFKATQDAHDVTWFCGGSQLVDRAGKPLIRLHHSMTGNVFTPAIAGEWFPLQSSLLRTDAFFEIGGFNPTLFGIEDIDLSRRMLLRGKLATIATVVACIGMGEEGSTTNRVRARTDGQAAREMVLADAQAITQMKASAPTAYWRGRITRAFLTSAVWNWRKRRFFTAVSRASNAIISFGAAGKALFRRSYWQAVVRPYQSISFRQGFRRINA